MIRLDHHGVTAFARWLKLDPKWYNGLLNFFHASSWNLSLLMRCWQRFIPSRLPLLQFNGTAMMVLDGIKLRWDIPSVEIVLSVIRDEYFFNFSAFGKTELYQIIMEKRRKEQYLYAKNVA